jgi:hypothetical protein
MSKLLDFNTLSSHPALSTYKSVPHSSFALANTILRALRTDGTPSQHPAFVKDFSDVTAADSMVQWSTYILILGYDHLGDFLLDQEELTRTLHSWIPGARLDISWFTERYSDNANAIVRNAKHTAAGYVFKLEDKCLFGTIAQPAPFMNSIYSASHETRSSARPLTYQLFALPDPFDFRHVQLSSIYPSLMTIRGLPIRRDLNTLTSATIFLVQQWLQAILPNQTYVLPTLLTHQVVKDGRQKRGLGRDNFYHSSFKDRTKKLIPHSLTGDEAKDF